MNPLIEELQLKVLGAIENLQHASDELKRAGIEWAEAECAYRKAKSIAYLDASTGEKRTVDHIKAMVDKQCETPMLRQRLATVGREAAYQLVQSRRSELSAMQSLLKRETEETAALRYGQQL